MRITIFVQISWNVKFIQHYYFHVGLKESNNSTAPSGGREENE